MDSVVYYFSGTGNSLVVARDIASRIKAELVSIPSVMGYEKIIPDGDVVGIVFPDYHSSLPNIVKRFLGKLDELQGRYLFGVCTMGGDGPGLAMHYLKEIIESKGGTLAFGFAVGMPYNYIIPKLQLSPPFLCVRLNPASAEAQSRKLSDWEKRIDSIVDYVKERRTGEIKTSAESILGFVERFRLRDSLGIWVWLKMAGYKGESVQGFWENWRFMDFGFNVDERCLGCGTCVKVCPVGNIKLEEGRPVWMHCCEQCFACLQWCPQSAIQFRKHTRNDNRYHHPDVNIQDMLSGKL
jgi:ferredoxin